MNQPTKRKAPAKANRQTERAGGSGARSKAPTGGSSKHQRSSARKDKSRLPVFLPLFTVWLLAVIILVGFLYWGKTGKPVSRPVVPKAKLADRRVVPSSKPGEPASTGKAKSTDQPVPAQPPSQQRPASARLEPSDQQPDQRRAPREAPPAFEEYQQIQAEAHRDRVEQLLQDFFAAQGIKTDHIARRSTRCTGPDGGGQNCQELDVQLPPEQNLAALQQRLLEKTLPLKPDVQFKPHWVKPDRLMVEADIFNVPTYRMFFSPRGAADTSQTKPLKVALNAPKPKPEVPPPAEVRTLPQLGKAAIVIDDFGLSLEMANAFLALPVPITFSVLPHQPHSQEIAQLAYAQDREVMVHLPMEPKGYPQVNPGPGALLRSMSNDKLMESLQLALASVPHAVGVNNHMGSLFTEQEEPMRLVLAELHKRGLYFLDSYTSPQSVACPLAERMRMLCGRRNIFLDHEQSESFIRSQLQRTIREAKIHGSAIAIGHPHPTTLSVLTQEAERFKKERVAIVPLKELLANGSTRR